MGLAVVKTGTGSGTDDIDDAPLPPSGLRSPMTDEIFARATEEQALSFYVAVGARIAATHALPEDAGLETLERAINAVWRDLGLGQVTLAMAVDGIAIEHRGHVAGSGQSPAWPRAAAALLQGAYGAWFESIGGATLHTRIVRQTSARIILHHGL